MYDKVTSVKFASIDDLREFVNEASKCDFDIDYIYNRMIIDAKSILGVLGVGINKECKVGCLGESQEFNKVLSRYATA